MNYLQKDIKLNSKFILVLLLFNIIIIGIYYSYALFEITVIQNSIVKIETGTIDITTAITGYDTPSFTLATGETKNITVTLTSTATIDISYKMYYDITNGVSLFKVTSTTDFTTTNNIVEGEMNTSKTITFTFQNTGNEDITITLGTQVGLKGYPISLEQGIELKLNEELGVPVKNAIVTSVNNPTDTSCKTYVEEDGIIYISGTKDCINFNYVWYSGKLWRITAIYPDGTMKMITDSNITTIAYGADNKFYTDENTTSYMYQWLNQEFLPTLYNYDEIIVEDAVWNASPGNGTISTKLPVEGQEEVLVNASVGLLNSYEYYKSYQNTSSSNGYLNIGYCWWLITPYSASSSYVWRVRSHGGGYDDSPSTAYGGRPSIYLKSGVQLIGGTGTESNPYRIKGDQEQAEANVTLINTRQSGEYVNFDGYLYRIVGIENETTKLIKDDYVKDENSTILTKAVASSTIFGKDTNTGSDNYWDYYLNNTWKTAITDDYENMLVEGTYYTKYFTGGNYKNTACATVSNATSIKDCDKTGVSTWSGYVGLPRYGEMFASQTRDYTYSNDEPMWLITPYSSSRVWYVDYYGGGDLSGPSNAYGGRPTINLKSEILIESGSGIKSNPYEIKLVETTETEEVQE